MEDDISLTVAMAERIFGDFADPQTLAHQPEAVWRPALWQALETAGLPRCWAPEPLGGHGLDAMAGFALLRAAGRAAVSVPLADTMLASWVLGQAGLAVPEGPLALLIASGRTEPPGMTQNTIGSRRIPFAAAAHWLVVVEAADGRADLSRIALVPSERCRFEPGVNLAGDPLDAVSLDTDAQTWTTTDAIRIDDVRELGAVARSLQMAGALESMLDLSVRYSRERIAFGKTISQFQAVQHNLAMLGGEVAAAVAVSASAAEAFATLAGGSDERLLEVAAAKIRCGEAARAGAAISHQVHGALGFTTEHVLHRYTLRALAWRDDFGSESDWALRLGRCVSRRSSAQLWDLLSSR